MAISLNKAITRNSDNTITTTTNYNELNVKASALVEDLVDKVETELASAETQINSQIGALQSAEQYATSAASSASQAQSSASSASQIVLGQSTGRANIKPVLNLDFANQKRLDSKVDFTRASTATYYDGKKQVKAEENLFANSDVSSIYFAKIDATVSSNTEIAPNGKLEASVISFSDASSRFQRFISSSVSTYTFSFYAKAQVETTVNIARYSTDLTPITVTTEWQRFTKTWNNISDGFFGLRSDGTTTDITIWGLQLEQRDFATAYTPTTDKPITNYIPVLSTAQENEPRFDYDLETKECKGLLIEEQRTNLVSDSRNLINNPSYALGVPGTTTYIPNATIDIMGNNDAFKCIYNDAYTINRLDIVTIVGTEYTFSFYCKNIDAQALKYRAYDMENMADIILTTSYLSQVSTDKWTRVSFTFTATSTRTGLYFQAGVGNGSAYFCGLQLEQGSFATSYIPTNGSQVTRTADNCLITGDNFSSFYNPSEGAIYIDFDLKPLVNYGRIFTLKSTLNEMSFHRQLNRVNIYCIYNNKTVADLTVLYADKTKLIYSYGNNTIKGGNSDNITTKETGYGKDFINLQIGRRNTLNYITGHIKKLAYYDKALSDTELQLMTQG